VNLGQWLGLVALLSAIYILWELRQVVLLVFAAIVLATAANSLARLLQRRFRLRRRYALFLTVGAIALAGFLFCWLIIPAFLNQFDELLQVLPTGFARFIDKLESGLSQLLRGLPLGFSNDAATKAFIEEHLQRTANRTNWESFSEQVGPLFRNFFAFFNNAIAAAAQLLLVIVLSLMLVANPHAYRSLFLQLLPSFYRRRADQVLNECEIALSNWFAGVSLSSSMVATLSGVGLLILGIPLALVNGLLAGLLNLIPNFGPTLSVVFPISVALVAAPDKVWAVLILYILVQQLESYLLTPTVMAHQVSLLPAMTLIAQIIFASLFGVLGLLLALPLAVVAQVCVREIIIHDILDRWHHPCGYHSPDWITANLSLRVNPQAGPVLASEASPTPSLEEES
jgi:predicted PurR-regulated permease PerM